jgi:hypothetical protein
MKMNTKNLPNTNFCPGINYSSATELIANAYKYIKEADAKGLTVTRSVAVDSLLETVGDHIISYDDAPDFHSVVAAPVIIPGFLVEAMHKVEAGDSDIFGAVRRLYGYLRQSGYKESSPILNKLMNLALLGWSIGYYQLKSPA